MKSRNGLLVLSRKMHEFIDIGDDISIQIARISRDSVRLAISAPKELLVLRRELKDRDMQPRPENETCSP